MNIVYNETQIGFVMQGISCPALSCPAVQGTTADFLRIISLHCKKKPWNKERKNRFRKCNQSRTLLNVHENNRNPSKNLS